MDLGGMMRFRAVLFDAYGTLFEDGLDMVLAQCGRMSRELGLGLTPGEFLTAWDRHWTPLIHGPEFVTLRESHHVSLRALFSGLGVDADSDRYVQDIFDRFSNSGIYDDVVRALGGLDGCLTGVVSNADAGHLDDALKRNGLSFPLVVSSESARCYKPAPGIFHEALEALQVLPEDALYVGDSQEDDIVGARAAGMSVAWLNRGAGELREGIPEPDFMIAGLAELSGIVK
jgi:2-haloacid dehalogenase